MYRCSGRRLDGPIGSSCRDAQTAKKKEERAFARSSFVALTGGKVRERLWDLSAGGGDRVADVGELARRLLAQGGQSHDADHGDEGQEDRVLHQGGATLALQVEAGGGGAGEGPGGGGFP